MLQRVSYWNLAVALPILGSMIVLREPLLALFGRGYEAGAAPLVLLAARAARAQRGRPADRRDQPLGPPARDALRQRARVQREPRALHHPRAALRHDRRGGLDADRALQRDAAAGRPGGAAVPHPPLPRRSAALRSQQAASLRSPRRRSRFCPGPRRSSRSSRAGSSSSRSTSRRIAALGVREETRELAQRARDRLLRRRPDLIERMGGIASPPTRRVDKKRRSAVDGCGRD